jgi:hypothetical protein
MPDWTEIVNNLTNETLDDLRTTGTELYDQFNDEDRAIFERTTSRIVELQASRIQPGADQDSILSDLQNNYNTMVNLVAKYDAITRQSFADFVLRLANRVITVVLAVAIPAT